jgi:hypothetical protein
VCENAPREAMRKWGGPGDTEGRNRGRGATVDVLGEGGCDGEWGCDRGACVRHLFPFHPLMPHVAEPDHLRAAHAHQVAIFRAMTPQQRLRQALKMNQMMRTALAAGFRARQPEWSEAQIKCAVADRILHAHTG